MSSTSSKQKECSAHFHRLIQLVRLEREADREQYRQKVEAKPLATRVREGQSWYPLEPIKSGYTFGEHAFVECAFPRLDKHDKHTFKAGKSVSLFTTQPGAKRTRLNGVVHFVHKNRIKIILHTSDLPNWWAMGGMGVDLLFDETTYQEMEKALVTVAKAKGDRLAEIRDYTFDPETGQTDTPHDTLDAPHLNDAQQIAVAHILSAPLISLVHGPPGTGKTTTLVEAVKQLCQSESTVLVSAPSNTAVDVLTERLAGIGLHVVRIGHVSRVDEELMAHTLDVQLSTHPDSKHIKKLKVDAAARRKAARRYKRRFDHEARLERQSAWQEARELQQWARQLEDRLVATILDQAQVICCTLVGASHPVLEGRRFKTLVIDEAAQALEPASWIPLLKASRVVLAGDPLQLPPTVRSVEADRQGLGTTLLERLLATPIHRSFLHWQYRMHKQIMGFSNAHFYGGRLKADARVADRGLPGLDHGPVLFVDTAGCGFAEETNPQSKSRYNPGELHILQEHLLRWASTDESFWPSQVVLLSPYREQVQLMEDSLLEEQIWQELPLSVQTIDGFQGQEADMVYISLVRSNERGEIGFLKDYRRMNVAMTRARKALVVIGDSATIGADEFYREFLEYCDREGEYRSAWTYMQT